MVFRKKLVRVATGSKSIGPVAGKDLYERM
jgi:hypothetical protein